MIGSSIRDSVPVAMLCFLDSTDFEDCLRNALYIGGDTDTIACMAGGIAQAYYREIPKWNHLFVEQLNIIDRFNNVFEIDYL
jgi:ADP-ribosylglycohydrolase